MRITVPIGVYLPAGVGVEIDGTAIGRLGYELCSPQGVCVATTFLNEELLGKFKAGGPPSSTSRTSADATACSICRSRATPQPTIRFRA